MLSHQPHTGQGHLSSNPSAWGHQPHETRSHTPEHLPSDGALEGEAAGTTRSLLKEAAGWTLEAGQEASCRWPASKSHVF